MHTIMKSSQSIRLRNIFFDGNATRKLNTVSLLCHKLPLTNFQSYGASLKRASTSLSSDIWSEIDDPKNKETSNEVFSLTSQLSAATQIRPKLRVQDLLNFESSSSRNKFSISSTASIRSAVKHLVYEKIGSSLVISPTGEETSITNTNDSNNSSNDVGALDGEIAGIVTARDLLRFIHEHQLLSDGSTSERGPRYTVADVMTPRDKLVYCSPTDSVRRCREIMFQCKVRNLPVIGEGKGGRYELKGLVTMKMIADSSFSLAETGGKKGYIHNVTGRKGLPEGTKISEDVIKRAEKQRQLTALDMELGSYSLPHPFKRVDGGVAMNRRLFGAEELCMDDSVCEDAHFTLKVHEQTYMCVADGVGSWRQYGVDPRLYSHRLVENALKVVEADAHHREIMGQSPLERDMDAIHPLDVITDAWHLTSSEEVTGSSTICVATLDKKLNQLSYSNIGDCGLMVVRHIDSETAGYMRERQLPRYLRTNDLRIAYLSQQQLRSFNLPYQLGCSAGLPNYQGSFESPADADTASIPVMPGDIIVLATDGLFDNVDLDDIVKEISLWERKWFVPREGQQERELRYPSPAGDTSAVKELAEQLVLKARELSLDKQRDSPFAILAKENDILWGGGMPDDTTVIVARVVTPSPAAGGL